MLHQCLNQRRIFLQHGFQWLWGDIRSAEVISCVLNISQPANNILIFTKERTIDQLPLL
jgi:hypothetical protein